MIKKVLEPYYSLTLPVNKVTWKETVYFSQSTDQSAFALMVLIHLYHTSWTDCDRAESEKAEHVMTSIIRTWGKNIIEEEISLVLEESAKVE